MWCERKRKKEDVVAVIFIFLSYYGKNCGSLNLKSSAEIMFRT